MEMIRKIEGAISAYKEKVKATNEQERIARVSVHPHKPECTGSGDVKVIDSGYFPVDGAFEPSVYIINKTQCTECGEIKDRRQK